MRDARMLKEKTRLAPADEVKALLECADAVDAQEDARFGEKFRDDELPEELRRRDERLAAIKAAKARQVHK